ncbi:MAG: transglycosylase SLT domain-containing protein [Deltaproteobacteria bacterium]|nr:transglycosylase SLT domain-containing protein [Deltaproteobacteria bacterium]
MNPDWLAKILFLLMAAALYLFTGCAGPTTPLGAPWATVSSETRNGPLAFISSLFKLEKADIRFWPRHQRLHGPGPLTILINDPSGVKSNYHLVVRHNGLDVTSSFLRQATVTKQPKSLRIFVPLVRLPADRENLIEVFYMESYARYEAPRCHAFKQGPLVSTNGFTPNQQLLELIRNISREHGFSPAFTAGLIAQESGFDPRTVSWAKAIGLTQVTPSARIRTTFDDPDTALTQLVLASYNSGYTRVSNAFARGGANWLSSTELREARKYVGRITSYCDQFSETDKGEIEDEDQT